MKLEGDLFHVLIDILQNWEKPSNEIINELARFSRKNYDPRIG